MTDEYGFNVESGPETYETTTYNTKGDGTKWETVEVRETVTGRLVSRVSRMVEVD